MDETIKAMINALKEYHIYIIFTVINSTSKRKIEINIHIIAIIYHLNTLYYNFLNIQCYLSHFILSFSSNDFL